MDKPIFVFCLLLSLGLTTLSFSQTIDTSALIIKVDSLTASTKSLYKQGNFPQAIKDCLQAKETAKLIYSKKNEKYWDCLADLGVLYSTMEQYDLAESYLLEEQEIIKSIEPPSHINLAENLDNIGSIYFQRSNLAEAEKYFLAAEDEWNLVQDTIKENLASHLNNLGGLYQSVGDWDKSIDYFNQTRKSLIAIVGETHPHVAITHANIGLSQVEALRYDEAEKNFLIADEMLVKIFGEEHPVRGQTLNNLGGLFSRQKQYDKAKPYSEKSLSIIENVFGRQHPNYSMSLKNYGQLHYHLAEYALADSILKEVLTLEEEALGTNHPRCGETFKLFAQLYYKTKNYPLAFDYNKRASVINKNQILGGASFLSEEELSLYSNKLKRTFNTVLSLDYDTDGANSNVSELAFDNLLFYKGFLQNAVASIRRLSVSNPELEDQFHQLKNYRAQLAQEYSKPLAARSNVDSLENQANNLEKELTRDAVNFGDAIKVVGWKDVQAKLKKGEAVIEFIHHQYLNPDFTDSTLYAAYIITPNSSIPKYVHLFEEQELNALFNPHQKRRADYVQYLYSSPDRGLVPVGEEHKSLYDLIWSPLADDLDGVKTIYFSPSGLLHRLNLNAIALAEEEYISDKYNLIQLNSSRSLVSSNLALTKNKTAVIYGGIDYDIVQDSLYETIDITQDLANRSSYYSSVLGGSKWTYLKWTLNELNGIKDILGEASFSSNLFTHKVATETSFKTLGDSAVSPQIIHIASHGFFFPEPDSSAALNSNQSVFASSANPMFRSGIILAGANEAWQGGSNENKEDDGILTAYEISQMNLSSTEIVVLSACETGLGDINGSEGVYGLQRAFKIAGAKYLIMSLWQVPDRQTKDFMLTFYRLWLRDGMEIPMAFKQTQKEMKERFYDPYFWAGFVLLE